MHSAELNAQSQKNILIPCLGSEDHNQEQWIPCD